LRVIDYFKGIQGNAEGEFFEWIIYGIKQFSLPIPLEVDARFVLIGGV